MNPDPKYSTRLCRLKRLQKSPVDSIFIAALPRLLARRNGVKRIVQDRRGFTVAELLVAALFGMIVMATLYGFYREQMFNLLSQETKTATLEDARGALDIMVRELRNAGAFPVTTDATCLKDGSGNPMRVVTASANSIQIQSDTDGNENCSATGENVTYALSGSTITRNGVTNPLVNDVVIPTGSDFLTYYPSGTDPPPFCFSTGDPTGCSGDLAANLGNIKRVKITFAVEVKNPNPKITGNISSSLSSTAEFRN